MFKYNSGVDENDIKEYIIKDNINLNETNMIKINRRFFKNNFSNILTKKVKQ